MSGSFSRAIFSLNSPSLFLNLLDAIIYMHRLKGAAGFTQAEAPERANALYELTCDEIRKLGVPVENGIFRTHMVVHIVNDGPVTILLDSKKQF